MSTIKTSDTNAGGVLYSKHTYLAAILGDSNTNVAEVVEDSTGTSRPRSGSPKAGPSTAGFEVEYATADQSTAQIQAQTDFGWTNAAFDENSLTDGLNIELNPYCNLLWDWAEELFPATYQSAAEN